MPIEAYDAIGFDMDLCIARYNFNTFLKLIFDSICAKLVRDHKYPTEMFPEDQDLDYLMRFIGRVVIDLKNLNLLKVGKDGEVLVAFSGYDKMTPE